MLNLVVCLLAAAPHVSVSRQAVRVDAQVLEAVVVEPGLLLVPQLAAALEKAGTPDRVVDAEADVPFSVLQRVLFTVASAGSGALSLKVGSAGPVQVSNPTPPTKNVFITVPAVAPDAGTEESRLLERLGVPPKAQLPRVSFSIDDEVTAERLIRLLLTARDAGFTDLAVAPSAVAPAPVVVLDQERVDKKLIRKIIRANRGLVKDCSKRAPGASGTLLLRWNIDASGSTSDVAVAEDGTRAPGLADCLVGVVRRLKFPPTKGDGVIQAAYPFVFGPKGSHALRLDKDTLSLDEVVLVRLAEPAGDLLNFPALDEALRALPRKERRITLTIALDAPWWAVERTCYSVHSVEPAAFTLENAMGNALWDSQRPYFDAEPLALSATRVTLREGTKQALSWPRGGPLPDVLEKQVPVAVSATAPPAATFIEVLTELTAVTRLGAALSFSGRRLGDWRPPTDKELIARAINSGLLFVSRCLEQSPGAKGRLVLTFTVQPDGAFTNVVVKKSDKALLEKLAPCVVAALGTLRSRPLSSPRPVSVTYPFEFKSE